MVNWKTLGIVLAAVVVIAVIVVIIVFATRKNKKDETDKKQSFRFTVPTIARRERYKGNKGSLDEFINGYIDVENYSWN